MKPINPLQTKEYIAGLLRKEIFSQGLPEGDELMQELVAEKLGISRMPVREAFQLLEQEGFLERLPNRHMRVVGIKTENFVHNFSILSAMETEIASALLRENRDIAPVRRVLGEYRAAAAQLGPEARTERELGVHLQLSALLEDRYLLQFHRRLLRGYPAYALNAAPLAWQSRLEDLDSVVRTMEDSRGALLRIVFDGYFDGIVRSLTEGGKR